jgi:2',3'-cyclic-nucleotide 2'-phosphodiesterase (5'-nucleotidase family)
MSQRFYGSQMVELLNLCSVNLATLGNHEFDFGAEVLNQRLKEARFTTVLANALAPPTFDLKPVVFWPTEKPFLAITGLAGNQTLVKAEKNGFIRKNPAEAVDKLLGDLRTRSAVGALVVLSHMERNEDMEIQKKLSE